VHTAQGVTADTTHAVLGANTTRALLYVAMTRGRHTSTAHLYERSIGDSEYGHQEPVGTHVNYRGDSQDAADLIRGILANHDQAPVTAHTYAAQTPGAAPPDRVRSLLSRRAAATNHRKVSHESWQTEQQGIGDSMHKAQGQHAGKSRTRDYGMEL